MDTTGGREEVRIPSWSVRVERHVSPARSSGSWSRTRLGCLPPVGDETRPGGPRRTHVTEVEGGRHRPYEYGTFGYLPHLVEEGRLDHPFVTGRVVTGTG